MTTDHIKDNLSQPNKKSQGILLNRIRQLTKKLHGLHTFTHTRIFFRIGIPDSNRTIVLTNTDIPCFLAQLQIAFQDSELTKSDFREECGIRTEETEQQSLDTEKPQLPMIEGLARFDNGPSPNTTHMFSTPLTDTPNDYSLSEAGAHKKKLVNSFFLKKKVQEEEMVLKTHVDATSLMMDPEAKMMNFTLNREKTDGISKLVFDVEKLHNGRFMKKYDLSNYWAPFCKVADKPMEERGVFRCTGERAIMGSELEEPYENESSEYEIDSKLTFADSLE